MKELTKCSPRLVISYGNSPMHNSMKSFALVILLSTCVQAFLPYELLAATYYISATGVDSNSGTQSAPWKTWQKAATTMVAGDTTLVMDGTYVSPEVSFTNSGTATSPIVFKSLNPLQAVLSSSSCNMGISVWGSYVTIEGIRIGPPPSGLSCANTASRTAIRCWERSLPNPSNPSTGYVGCTVRAVKVDYSTTFNGGVKTNQDFSLVENSEIHMGVEAFNNFGTIFRNNIVYTQVNGWQGAGIFGKGGVRSLQIYNNVVYMNPADYGIFLGGNSGNQWVYDSSTGIEAYNSIAYNNVVVVLSASPRVAALGQVGAKNSAFYNNVVAGAGGGLFLATGGAAGYPQPASENPIFKNNIITCGGGAATTNG